MSENGEIYTSGKKFTLLPAVTEGINLTSIEWRVIKQGGIFGLEGQCMYPDTGMVTSATTYYREEGRSLRPSVSQPKSDRNSLQQSLQDKRIAQC